MEWWVDIAGYRTMLKWEWGRSRVGRKWDEEWERGGSWDEEATGSRVKRLEQEGMDEREQEEGSNAG